MSHKSDSSATLPVSRDLAADPNPFLKEAEFDRYAAEYATLLKDPVRDLFSGDGMFFHSRKWELLHKQLQRRGLRTQAADWLDVGCGKGELLSLGKSHFRRAAGCDPSAGMLRNSENVVLQTDPFKVPFPDASFDVITAVCVYHHVPLEGRPSLTRDLFRVLRPGGLACFIEHNPFNPLTQLIVSRTPVDADAHLVSHWQMRSLVRSSGFRKPESEFFLYLPEKLYTKLAGLESLLCNVPLGGQYAVFCSRPDMRKRLSVGRPVPALVAV